MKWTFFLVLCCCVTGYKSYAQPRYNIDTIHYQGSNRGLVNLVILGDGFTLEEQDKFVLEAKKFTQYFFEVEPLNIYKSFFNVFAVRTVSLQSGAIHDCTAADCPTEEPSLDEIRTNNFGKEVITPSSNPETLFGSRFDNHGIHRKIMPLHTELIDQVVKNHVPDCSQVLILVNSPYYGGSGGRYATVTLHSASKEVAMHEIGHSFAGLGDEYWVGNQYVSEKANRTSISNPAKVPWKEWLGVDGIGVYAYGGTAAEANWYRPHQSCKMQLLDKPFCKVCQEAFVKAIYRHASPIASQSPSITKELKADKVMVFSLDLIAPITNTLKIEWFLNDRLLCKQTTDVVIDPALFELAGNVVKAVVSDTTALVRDKGDVSSRMFTARWEVKGGKQPALIRPSIMYGNSLQTCHGRSQVVNVEKPMTGITYRWYRNKGDKIPFATGRSLFLDSVIQDSDYFLEASFGDLVSDRQLASVSVLPKTEVRHDDFVIKIDKRKNTLFIKTLRISKDEFYIWKSTDGQTLNFWDNGTASYLTSKAMDQEILSFRLSDVQDGIVVYKIQKRSLCQSEGLTLKILP